MNNGNIESRIELARSSKIEGIQESLFNDEDERVRVALMGNKSLSINLLEKLTKHCSVQGYYVLAEPLLDRLRIIRADLGEADEVKLATCLNCLSEVCNHQGNNEQAQIFIKQAIDIRKRKLGINHPDTAESLDNLGTLLLDNDDEAERLLRCALDIREKALGAEHCYVGISLNNLYCFFERAKKHELAEAFLMRANSIWEKILDCDQDTLLDYDRRELAVCLNNLGVWHRKQGDSDQAECCYKRSLSLISMMKNHNHPQKATTLFSFGLMHKLKENYEQAEEYYKKSLEIREKAFGPDSKEVAWVLHNLGYVNRSKKDFDKAELYFKRGLEIEEKVFGDNSEEVVHMLSCLGNLYKAQKKYSLAESFLKRTLAIREVILPANDSRLANSLYDLGNVYCFQRRYKEGEVLFRRALSIRKDSLSPDHLGIASCQFNVALLCRKKYPLEAYKLLKECFSIRKKQLSADHPLVLEVLKSLRTEHSRLFRSSKAAPSSFLLDGLSDIEDFEFSGLNGQEALDAWNNIYG